MEIGNMAHYLNIDALHYINGIDAMRCAEGKLRFIMFLAEKVFGSCSI